MALLSTVYTTATKVKRLMSATFADELADNDRDGMADDEVMNDAINAATEEIDAFAREQYTQAQIASSSLVGRWATKMAAAELCLQRGNPVPESWAAEVERIRDNLEKIRGGKYDLPGVPRRTKMYPTLSNLTVDRRYHRSTIRVTEANSSDAPSALEQDTTHDLGGIFD